jgi:hypothetical protein
MPLKANKPVTRESSAMVETHRGQRELLVTIHQDTITMRPKATRKGGDAERKANIAAVYAAAHDNSDADRMQQSSAAVHTGKGEKPLMFAVRGSTLLMRLKGDSSTEMLDLVAAYDLAIKLRVSAASNSKPNANVRRRR